MDLELERWIVIAIDDAAARVPLPPLERRLPPIRQWPRRSPVGLFAAAVLVLIAATLLISVGASRVLPAAPGPTPRPAGDVLLPGGTESQTWGRVWVEANGFTVLRPTTLPDWGPGAGANGVVYHVTIRGSEATAYQLAYFDREASRPVPPRILFMAERADAPPPRTAAGEQVSEVSVRGERAQLITGTDRSVRLIWTEAGFRYWVQAQPGTAAGELLRSAESLRPVVDAEGNTR